MADQGTRGEFGPLQEPRKHPLRFQAGPRRLQSPPSSLKRKPPARGLGKWRSMLDIQTPPPRYLQKLWGWPEWARDEAKRKANKEKARVKKANACMSRQERARLDKAVTDWIRSGRLGPRPRTLADVDRQERARKKERELDHLGEKKEKFNGKGAGVESKHFKRRLNRTQRVAALVAEQPGQPVWADTTRSVPGDRPASLTQAEKFARVPEELARNEHPRLGDSDIATRLAREAPAGLVPTLRSQGLEAPSDPTTSESDWQTAWFQSRYYKWWVSENPHRESPDRVASESSEQTWGETPVRPPTEDLPTGYLPAVWYPPGYQGSYFPPPGAY